MLLASNQITIKVGNQGFDPVFMAAARSLIGLLALLYWMYFCNLLVFPLKTNFIPGFFLGFLLWFWLEKNTLHLVLLRLLFKSQFLVFY